MQSRVDSANWPMKAKFFIPSGTTFGRSVPLRVRKKDVMKGIMQGRAMAPSTANWSIS
jgi:hypothetical protein